MRTKFEWIESMSCPLGYPAEVYRGGLISKDGTYTSIYLGVGHGSWGEGGGGMRDSFKQIPNRLEAIWVSYAEGCTYEINTEIDYDKMLQLFNEGYYTPSMSRDAPEPRKENYTEINVGFAPGGVVVIWISGPGRQVEIGRYQGEKVVVSRQEINQLDAPDQLLFSEEWRQKIMNNPKIIPPELQEANKNKPIPFGLWDTYRQKYNWNLEIELPNNEKLKDIGFLFYNGEKHESFGEVIFDEHKEIPNEFLWKHKTNKTIPSEIDFSWLVENRFYGDIKFNEEEIIHAFQEIFKDNPESEAKLIISVNEPKTYASVKLVGNGKEIWILNSEITVRKTNLTF